MSWECEHVSDWQIIKVKPPQDVDLNSCKEVVPKLKAAAEEHSCLKFLYDFRESRLRLKTMDIYDLPDLENKSGLSSCRHVAVVVSDGCQEKDDFEFLETRYQNYGIPLRLFLNLESALHWLNNQIRWQPAFGYPSFQSPKLQSES